MSKQQLKHHSSCREGEREQVSELVLAEARIRTTRQQRVSGFGSCRDGERTQTREREIPEARLESWREYERKQATELGFPKTTAHATRQQRAIGLGKCREGNSKAAASIWSCKLQKRQPKTKRRVLLLTSTSFAGGLEGELFWMFTSHKKIDTGEVYHDQNFES